MYISRWLGAALAAPLVWFVIVFNWCCRRLRFNLHLRPCCLGLGLSYFGVGVWVKQRPFDLQQRRKASDGSVLVYREWEVSFAPFPLLHYHLIASHGVGVIPADKVVALEDMGDTLYLTPGEAVKYREDRSWLRADVLTDWSRETHEAMKKKGFYDKPKSLLEQMALINTEIGEATEELRSIHLGPEEIRYNEDGKPVGFPTELADVIIRILDTAACAKCKIGDAMIAKERYNAKRAYKHNKSC